MLNGNVIGKVNATTTGSGSGVWSLREQFLAGVASIWPLNRITDSLWSKTALLLKTNGVNNATNATFVDSSSNNFTVTRTGTPTQGSLSPYVPTGHWGGYFDGSGDYLSVDDHSALDLPGDFTIEWWMNPQSGMSDSAGIIGHRSVGGFTDGTDWVIRAQVSAGKVGFGYSYTGAYYDMGALTVGEFTHYAASRSGSTLRMFRNGVLITTATNTGTFSTAAALLIGENAGNGIYYKGTFSNLRIVKGTAVYTAAFTPPTAPLTAISGTSLLCLQDNRFKDNSTNNFAITKYGDTSVTRFSPFQATYETTYGGSGYFNGSGDYLTVPGSTALQFGTGDFTVEGWLNPSAFSTYPYIFSSTASSGNAGGIRMAMGSGTGYPVIALNTGIIITSSVEFKRNSWTHFALVRSGVNMTLFMNGVPAGSISNATSFTSDTFLVGQVDNSYWFNGYISNFRIVKGTAIYTAAFTPPTAPVTSVSGTSLLLNFNNAGVYDAARSSNLTLFGDAKVSTSVEKFTGDGSVYFDGTGDYLTVPDNAALQMGTSDFTYEFWWYPMSFTGYQTLFTKGGSQAGSITMQTDTGTGKPLVASGGSYIISTTSAAASLNTWNHVALVRSGTTVTVYLNGVSVGSGTLSSNLNNTSVMGIGIDNLQGLYPIQGYISNFRITRAARYAANFTPPTAALASANPA